MSEANLEQEIAGLRAEVAHLRQHRLLRMTGSARRELSAQFMRGLAFGLGSVIGATFLVSVLVFALSSINFIPVLGEWAAEIITVIEGQVE